MLEFPGAEQVGEEDHECTQPQVWSLQAFRKKKNQGGEQATMPAFNSGTVWQQGAMAGQGQWQTVDGLA